MVALYIFIIGLIIGSFLNVVIYRLPRRESIILPPSHCPGCQERLALRDLIPIISYVANRARCRYCGQKISWQYPVVEALTGLIILFLYFKYGLNTTFIRFSILVLALITCSFIDIRYKIIPNIITYPGIVIGLVFTLLTNQQNLILAFMGVLIPAGFLFLITYLYPGGLGLGDVKLVAMIGAFIGWQHTLLVIFIGALVGSVLGIILMVIGVINRQTRIPFGPFISLGVLLILFFGEELLNIYLGFFNWL